MYTEDDLRQAVASGAISADAADAFAHAVVRAGDGSPRGELQVDAQEEQDDAQEEQDGVQVESEAITVTVADTLEVEVEDNTVEGEVDPSAISDSLNFVAKVLLRSINHYIGQGLHAVVLIYIIADETDGLESKVSSQRCHLLANCRCAGAHQ